MIQYCRTDAAVADLWLAITMVRVDRFPRIGKWLVFGSSRRSPSSPISSAKRFGSRAASDLAQHAARFVPRSRASDFFPMTAAWGALFYTCAALAWTWCFVAARYWFPHARHAECHALVGDDRRGRLAALTHFDSTGAVVRLDDETASAFIQLQLWLALVAERVWRATVADGLVR